MKHIKGRWLFAPLTCFVLTLAACGESDKPSDGPSPAPSYVQISRYASEIADVSKTIQDCVSAEQKASPEHLDTSFMTDKEIAICGGDNESVDAYLSLSTPKGFDRTAAVISGLRTDLENHDANSVTADGDYHVELADVSSIESAFRSDLSSAKLAKAVKQRIISRL